MAGSAFRFVVTCSSRSFSPWKSAKSIISPPQVQPSIFQYSPSVVHLVSKMSSLVGSPLAAAEQAKPELEDNQNQQQQEDLSVNLKSTEETSNSSSALTNNDDSQSSAFKIPVQVADKLPEKTEEEKKVYERVRKRKLVLLLSYCGQGYYGMQLNPEMRTIEKEFFDALYKNNYIDDESLKKPQSGQFQRAARTDKNVSAARQIISMKLPETLKIDKINEHLPPEIRVMGMKRVTRHFDSKNNCDARTYMYMLPSFAFAPVDAKLTEDFRITPELIEQVQATLNLYIGSKNYHNFTSRKRAHDPSAMRQIISFTCGQPFVKDGLEYVILRVKGQSFMLHQIRKMIGLVIAYMRGYASLDTFKKCWTAERIDIPKAPGVGLMLDYVHYDRYDKKFGSDGMHDPITWDGVEDRVLKFCDEYIYPVVTKCENEEKSMMSWLTTIPFHTYDVREPGDNSLDDKPGPGKGDMQSQEGKAFRAVVYSRGGDEPNFSKSPRREEDDEDASNGDEDENASAAKKSKLEC